MRWDIAQGCRSGSLSLMSSAWGLIEGCGATGTERHNARTSGAWLPRPLWVSVVGACGVGANGWTRVPLTPRSRGWRCRRRLPGRGGHGSPAGCGIVSCEMLKCLAARVCSPLERSPAMAPPTAARGLGSSAAKALCVFWRWLDVRIAGNGASVRRPLQAVNGRSPSRRTNSKRRSVFRWERNARRVPPLVRSSAKQGPSQRLWARDGAVPVVLIIAASGASEVGKPSSSPRRRTACAAPWLMLQASASPRRGVPTLSGGDTMLSRAWPRKAASWFRALGDGGFWVFDPMPAGRRHIQGTTAKPLTLR